MNWLEFLIQRKVVDHSVDTRRETHKLAPMNSTRYLSVTITGAMAEKHNLHLTTAKRVLKKIGPDILELFAREGVYLDDVELKTLYAPKISWSFTLPIIRRVRFGRGA